MCTEEALFLRDQKCWQLTLVPRPVLFYNPCSSGGRQNDLGCSGEFHLCLSLPLHFSSFWSIATHCLGLTCLPYKPLSDPSSPILMARASPSRYTQTADTVTGPKSTLHQPGAFISRREEPQHWQQWQPWPAKTFLEWYSWRLAASLTKLAVTAENLPGRFAQKKEMGCGRVWWWGEENISEHIPIFSHIFLTP